MNKKNTYLTAKDIQLMQDIADTISFSFNEIIIKQGDIENAIYIINEGVIAVEQNGIILARLGAGEIFGEMSFIENKPISATIVAGADTKIARIPSKKLDALLSAQPNLASRFYKTLAVNFSSRLRNTSNMLTQLRMGRGESAPTSRLARVNMLTNRQVPQELVDALSDIKTSFETIKSDLNQKKADPEQVYPSLKIALNSALQLLQEYTSEEKIFEMSYSDLLSFRNDNSLQAGIGVLIFRELFSILMLSNTMSRLYARPRGVLEDYESVHLIRENIPVGDGRIGSLVDQWFLDRFICKGRRDELHFVEKSLKQHAITRACFNLCDLASGTAAATLAVLQAYDGATATCLDRDLKSLQYVFSEIKALKLMNRTNLICSDLSECWTGNSEIYLDPQHIFLALGIFEYLEDQEVIDLLRWCRKNQAENGIILFTTILPTNPDLALMSQLLEWPVKPRQYQQVEELCQQAGFDVKDTLTLNTTENYFLHGILQKGNPM